MLFRTHNMVNVHNDLMLLVKEVSKKLDIMVICGHRGQLDQDEAYKRGASKVKFPNSKHNSLPSKAIDCVVTDVRGKNIDWKNIKAFEDMIVEFKLAADRLGIKIECGGDWKMRDYPHIELV